jgi:hypothetical protein
MKILATSLSLAFLVGATSLAAAQTPDYVNQNRAAVRALGYGANSRNGVVANGRCNGVSSGTGERRCGTATGGPVGGLDSRN